MITEFQGHYRFLSNFWPINITDGQFLYPSVEHAYQAHKTNDLGQRKRISHMNTPGMAKRASRGLVIRDDWNDVKYDIMLGFVRQKFTDTLSFDLGQKLVATGSQPIIEGNRWHDNYWGSCHCNRHNGDGQNKMGEILMLIRTELRGMTINEDVIG